MDEARLREEYYNPAGVGSFGGAKRLSDAAGVKLERAQEWLTDEFAYSLHKPSRKRYATRPYRTSGIDRKWQSDLVEMIEFEG